MRTRSVGVLGLALLPVVACASCRRAPSASRADVLPDSTAADGQHGGGDLATRTASAPMPGVDAASLPDPAEAIGQWRTWRSERRYRLLAPHIDAAQRNDFLDTLVAVDMVLQANSEACAAIADVLGAHRIEAWDLSSLGTDLGIFSRDMNIVRADLEGDRARIVFQVGERLPLETAELRWQQGDWVYKPGAGPAEVPSLLRELAVTLTEVAETIRRERPDAPRIHQEYRLRVLPRLRKLERAVAPPPTPGT